MTAPRRCPVCDCEMILVDVGDRVVWGCVNVYPPQEHHKEEPRP